MAPIDAVVYGRLFQDAGHRCLFVRSLGYGRSCTAQLVHNYTTGGLCVRKSLSHPVAADGKNYAVQEADQEVRIVRLLAAAAADAGHQLRVTALLSASSTPDGGRVSHWDLCNGGTLHAFLQRAASTGTVLPEGLALHFLLQILETLDFMYTGMKSAVYHKDLHARNIMLHYTPGNPIPDVYLIDFGRAMVVPGPEDQDQHQHQGQIPTPSPEVNADDDSNGLPGWDIVMVLHLITHALAGLTLPPEKRTDPGRVKAHLNKRPAGDNAADKRHPLRTAYHMLDDLHHDFAECMMADLKEQGRRRKANLPAVPLVVHTPSLKPVLAFLRHAVKKHLPRRPVPDVAINEEFRKKVLVPERERAEMLSKMRPKLCRGVGELCRALVMAGENGPWDVAEVDAEDPAFGVVGVLRGVVEGEYGVDRGEDGEEEDEEENGDADEDGEVDGKIDEELDGKADGEFGKVNVKVGGKKNRSW